MAGTQRRPARSGGGGRADGYGQWLLWRERRQQRRHAAALLATGAGLLIGNALLLVQLTLGAFRAWPLASAASWLLTGWTLLCVLLMVAIPEQFLGFADRVARGLLGWLLGVLTRLLLWAVYWMSLPLARWVGRRGFVRRHPASAPWAYPGSPWRIPTWTGKVPACEVPGRSSGNAAVRALGLLMRQRNVFLVLVLVLLLLVTSISLLAQSAVVAPMIYTIF